MNYEVRLEWRVQWEGLNIKEHWDDDKRVRDNVSLVATQPGPGQLTMWRPSKRGSLPSMSHKLGSTAISLDHAIHTLTFILDHIH